MNPFSRRQKLLPPHNRRCATTLPVLLKAASPLASGSIDCCRGVSLVTAKIRFAVRHSELESMEPGIISMGKSFHLQYLRRETRKVSVREGGEEPDRCRIRTLGWENLSLEVLSAIGKCLKSRIEICKFRSVSEISKGYRFCTCSGSTNEHKVVLCSSSAPTSPNSEEYTALVLYSGGFLVALSIRNKILDEVREIVRESEGSWCKDVICFKESFYAVGGGGKLSAIDRMSLKLTDIVADLICEDFCALQLVESCQGLLLVVKNKSRVYKLNDIQHKWEAVKTLGDEIMFMDADLCFLVSTQDIFKSKGDFVVFSSVFFFRSAEYIKMTENHWVYIFCLDHGGKKDSQLKSSKLSYQSIARMLWPPPTWFYAWDSKEDVEVQPYVSIQHSSHRAKEASISFEVSEAWEQAVVVSPLNPCNRAVGSISVQQPVVISSLNPSEPAMGDAVMLKISEDSVAQPREKAATMVKFQGVDIRPDLLPILQKVWEKYEDVEGSRLQSCDIKAAALESLAKMIQLEAIMSELIKAKARVEEMKLEFFGHISEVEQGLDEDMKLVSDSMPISGPIDPEECLGEGLC
uniref:KIB1-4 beta-propeller domain-containing protein n=1 Tax=Chenopodium quinoa TaxID=63459 RepID=A0A803MFS1_CHEQI